MLGNKTTIMKMKFLHEVMLNNRNEMKLDRNEMVVKYMRDVIAHVVYSVGV